MERDCNKIKDYKPDLEELMNSLKLFPFMGMGDIPEGGDINEYHHFQLDYASTIKYLSVYYNQLG